MRIIRPMVVVEDDLNMPMPNGETLASHMAKKTEMFVRKCYKSEGRMTSDSHANFLPAIFHTRRHTGIAEHRMISVTFITDRGVSHEGVRHRMAAYLQESTRYCDYSGDKVPTGVTYILPPWVNSAFPEEWNRFILELQHDDMRYAFWRRHGWAPEEARYWLPQGVKTEYAASLNLGSWHNFLVKRTAPAAHPQMRQLAIPLLHYFKQWLPQFFSDIEVPQAGSQDFVHKDRMYKCAALIVNPYYDQISFDVVHQGA